MTSQTAFAASELVVILAIAGSLLVMLPVVAKILQRNSNGRLRDVGHALAPFVLWVAFNLSLLAMGGVALKGFGPQGAVETMYGLGFLLLQPVGIVVSRRIAREGEVPRKAR
jgi:hypothetical protein